MLDHVSLGVTDIDRSRRFYDAALRPLGLVRVVDFGESRGSDYGAAPGSLGVEFTITREAEVRTPIRGDAHSRRASLLPRSRPRGGRCLSCGGACPWGARRWRARASAALSRRLLLRFRVGSGRSSRRGSLPCADEPNDHRHGLTASPGEIQMATGEHAMPRSNCRPSSPERKAELP
jgi:catechol 2,3-dioxygenase-like lactoylglutathione lyase family enzyme